MCDTWAMRKNQVSKLQDEEMRYLRFGIFLQVGQIRNEGIKQKLDKLSLNDFYQDIEIT